MSLSLHSDPFVSRHIRCVSSNLCDLASKFKWLQREGDTYSPQLDWIQARLIYDFLTKNVTQRAVIIRLPFSNRNKCHGVVHGVAARCAGQAILSQSFLQKPFGANEAINQSLFEEIRSVNGIKDDTTIWIDGRDNFKNTARVPQLREINKYDYLLLRMEFSGNRLVNNAEIMLTYPAIDDAVYLFVDPSTFWRNLMENKGWMKAGMIITERGNPVNVWECPLESLLCTTAQIAKKVSLSLQHPWCVPEYN